MNFKVKGRVLHKPELIAKIKAEPFRFETTVAGSCEFQLSALSGRLGPLRIRAAVPFLKRRHMPVIGGLEAFPFHLQPIEIRCATKGVGVAGVLGVDGMATEIATRGDCNLEGEVEGCLPGSTGGIHIDFDDDKKRDHTDKCDDDDHHDKGGKR